MEIQNAWYLPRRYCVGERSVVKFVQVRRTTCLGLRIVEPQNRVDDRERSVHGTEEYRDEL